MEWSNNRIMELIEEGWTLSYDRTNKRFKLQKRVKVNGKSLVKSYTLPKQFNDFCYLIKHCQELKKKIEDLKSRIDKIEDKLNQMVIPVGKILLRCPNCDKWMVVIDTG